MFNLALVLVLTLHLVAVNLAMAGPLAAIWLEWRLTRRQDAASGRIGRQLAWWSLGAAAVGIGLGLTAMALLPAAEAEPYRRAFAGIPALRWWNVAGELAFYVLCQGLYAGLWDRLASHRGWHRLLALLAATDLMYHFPPLFAIISTWSLRPELLGLPLDRSLYWKLLLDGETLSRVIHHWLAATAMTGLAVAWLASRAKQQEADSAELRPAAVGGSRIALAATLAQLPVGVWVLVELPPMMQNQVLGGDLLATLLFGASLLAALGLLHHLAMMSLGDVSQSGVWRSGVLMVAVVLLMVATLHRARQQAYGPMDPPARMKQPMDTKAWPTPP